MSASLETALAKLETDYADKRLQLEREYRILGELPPDLRERYEWGVHIYPLYGRAGALHCNYQRHNSTRSADQPSLEVVATLAAAFPTHAPIVLYRDGPVGIQLQESVDSLPVEKRERASITALAPYWATFEPARYSQLTSIHWIARIADSWIECVVKFPCHDPSIRGLGRVAIRYEHAGRFETIVGVLENTYVEDTRTAVLGNSRLRSIRYASGSRETPGHHLVYWEPGSLDPADTTVTDLVNALR